ncbi:MAG TPA: signal peptidase I, partial [Actinomycetota bacterium]|nr:signal peptidase I [Actinomycetota bacterium]
MPDKYVPKYRAPKRAGFGRSNGKNSSGHSGDGDFRLSRKKETVEAPPAHSSHVRPAEAPSKPAPAPVAAAPVETLPPRVDPPPVPKAPPPASRIEDLFAPESAAAPPSVRATDDQFNSVVAGKADQRPPAVKASQAPAESLRSAAAPTTEEHDSRAARPESSGSTMVDSFEGTKVRSAIRGTGEAWDPFLKDPEPERRRFSRSAGMSDLDKLTASKETKRRKKPEKAKKAVTSHERQQHQTLGQWFREIVILGLVAILTAVLLTNYVVQAFFIPSESMEDTLVVDDRVLVNKLVYRFKEPEPGDIIVFESPDKNTVAEPRTGPIGRAVNEVAQGLGLRSSVQDLIKRVIAVEGQTIEVRVGSVFVDGEQIDEPYRKDFLPMPDFPATEVPEGTVFVMGDNRFQSKDSRAFGPVDKDTIVGRGFALIWP